MFNTSDIKQQLIDELHKGNIKDTGYQCQNGLHYVELRNISFIVDKDYIFDGIPNYADVNDEWYKEHYEPILKHNNQFEKCIERICNNPNTRQAVLIMGSPEEYNDPTGFICTMYMHIFLDKNIDDTYNIMYIVHMRSSDSVEFQSDIQWHHKILNIIKQEITKKLNVRIKDTILIWNADTLQLYDKFFNQITQ